MPVNLFGGYSAKQLYLVRGVIKVLMCYLNVWGYVYFACTVASLCPTLYTRLFATAVSGAWAPGDVLSPFRYFEPVVPFGAL